MTTAPLPAGRPYPSACHTWLHVASDRRTRTYRCVACGETLVLPREEAE